MTLTKTITGTYGSHHTPTDIYVRTNSSGFSWYVCDDSVNVCGTYEDLEDGVDVETVEDCDFYTAGDAITSEEELEESIAA